MSRVKIGAHWKCLTFIRNANKGNRPKGADFNELLMVAWRKKRIDMQQRNWCTYTHTHTNELARTRTFFSPSLSRSSPLGGGWIYYTLHILNHGNGSISSGSHRFDITALLHVSIHRRDIIMGEIPVEYTFFVALSISFSSTTHNPIHSHPNEKYTYHSGWFN